MLCACTLQRGVHRPFYSPSTKLQWRASKSCPVSSLHGRARPLSRSKLQAAGIVFLAGGQVAHGVDDGDGPNMVPLDPESDAGLGGTSDDVFGPLAVLLVGFMEDEVDKFRTFMIHMEADMVKIMPCTKRMLQGTLQEALESSCPAYDQPLLGQRRAVIVSGMYTSEVMAVVAEYRAAGLPPAVFAAAVPNNYQHVVKELVEEIYSDDRFMKQNEASRMQ